MLAFLGEGVQALSKMMRIGQQLIPDFLSLGINIGLKICLITTNQAQRYFLWNCLLRSLPANFSCVMDARIYIYFIVLQIKSVEQGHIPDKGCQEYILSKNKCNSSTFLVFFTKVHRGLYMILDNKEKLPLFITLEFQLEYYKCNFRHQGNKGVDKHIYLDYK